MGQGREVENHLGQWVGDDPSCIYVLKKGC